MKIRYYDTLYKREAVYTLSDDAKLEFKNGRVCFSWCGSKLAIEVEYIIEIERC